MPWNLDNLPPAAQNLTTEQKERFVDVANAILEQGGAEDSAIRIGLFSANRIDMAVNGVIPFIRAGDIFSPVMPDGKSHLLELSEDKLDEGLLNYERLEGADRKLCIRYGDHSPTSDAAGKINHLIKGKIDGNATIFGLAEFNEMGHSAVKDERQMYISPEFYVNGLDRKTNQPIGMDFRGSCVTNQPWLRDMPQAIAFTEQTNGNPLMMVARQNAKLSTNMILLADPTPTDHGGFTMLEKLKAILNMDASEKEIIEKIRALMDAESNLEVSEAKVEELTEAATAMETKYTGVQSEMVKLSEENKNHLATIAKLQGDTKQKGMAELVSAKVKDGSLKQDQSELWITMLSDDANGRSMKLFESLTPMTKLSATGIGSGEPGAEPTQADKYKAAKKDGKSTSEAAAIASA